MGSSDYHQHAPLSHSGIPKHFRLQFHFAPVTLLLLFLTTQLPAQDILLKGTVRAAGSGETIVGANVIIRELLIGAASDSKGGYTLKIPGEKYDGELKVDVTHIGYARYVTILDRLREDPDIVLEPTVIRSPELEVVGRRQSRAANDLPASVSNIEIADSPIQAVVDLGVLLDRESSLKIDEDASGRKEISIRGSNPDEVLVLYDGIPLNSGDDNIVNLAQINLNDVERVEIIKGSNTTLFGTGAFGGVINIIPRTSSKHLFRISGKTGTYDTKDITFQVFKSRNQLNANYKYSRSEIIRQIPLGGFQIDVPNTYSFHSAQAGYTEGNHELKFTGHFTGAEYTNPFSHNKREEDLRAAGVKFSTSLLFFNDLNAEAYYHAGRERELYDDPRGLPIFYEENIEDKTFSFRIEDREIYSNWDFYFTYDRSTTEFRGNIDINNQFIELDYHDNSILERTENGAAVIAKMHGPIESNTFQYMDWDVSTRYYHVATNRIIDDWDGVQDAGSDLYNGLIYQMGFKAGGSLGNSYYYLFLSNGNNIKYPTLSQLFNLDQTFIVNYMDTKLEPEKNTATEIGAHFERSDPRATGAFHEIGIHAAWFRSNYLEKIVQFQPVAGPPVPVNTGNTTSSGWDLQVDFNVIRNLLSANLGAMFLDIENKAAFQFKPDKKFTASANLTWKGIQVTTTFFHEGEQAAFFWNPGQPLSEFSFDARTDVDLHARYKINIASTELFASVSSLNILNSGEDFRQTTFYYMGGRQWYLNLGFAI